MLIVDGRSERAPRPHPLAGPVPAERVEQVVRLEASAPMVALARQATTAGNVRYLEAPAVATELLDGGADIVTCARPSPSLRLSGIAVHSLAVERSRADFATAPR